MVRNFPEFSTNLNFKGYITVKNRGDYPIELCAQKRRGAQRGALITLEPHEEHCYNYRGHWCIEISHGEPTDIEIVEWQGAGGETKGDNRLGMTQ